MHRSRKISINNTTARAAFMAGVLAVGLTGTSLASGSSSPPTYDGSRSQIVSITQCNASDECVTPVTLSWNDENTSWPQSQAFSDFGKNNYSYPLVSGDWNGDGFSDLGRVTSTGMSFYLGSASGMSGNFHLNDFSVGSFANSNDNPLITGDWNGDGLVDVARVSSSDVKFYVSRGTGWNNHPTLNDFGKSSFANGRDYPIITGDWNGDGLLDLGRVTQGGMSLRTSLNSRYALLDSVTNSRGHLSSIHYKTLTDSTLYKKGAAATYPEQDYTSAMTVVSSIERDDGIGGKRHIDYLYEGLRGDVARGSFLGFSKVTSTDRERTTQTVTDYRQDWPFSRRIAKATRKLSNGVLISVKENTWEQVTTKPDVTSVRLAQSVAKSYEINGQTPTDPGTGDPIDPLPIYDITLSAHAENYDVAANLTGWNGTDKVHVNVTVDAGVVLGSTSADSYALDFTDLPQGSTASLTNNGDIIGYYGVVNGGSGGHAVKTSVPLKVTNNGTIYAGGGGAKGANATAYGNTTSYSSSANDDRCWQGQDVSCSAAGGNGGRGAGWYGAGLFYANGAGGSGGASCTAGTPASGYPNCTGYQQTATGATGGAGSDLGIGNVSGATAGIVFNGYSLITFNVAGLWGGQVSEEATPINPGNGNTDPTGTADYTLTIAAHTENVNVATLLATETNWDGATVSSVKVIVEPNIVVGSTSASTYAIDFSTLPTGFTAILDNKGSIVGSYGTVNNGDGGHAVKTNILLDVYNAGVIYAGGGGGHNGASRTATGYDSDKFYSANDDRCGLRAVTCTAPGGSGGHGAGWYGNGQFYNEAVMGTNGGYCSAGGVRRSSSCTGEYARSATGVAGTDGGAFGLNGESGGVGGIAFDGINLITFKNEGLWAGRTIDGPDIAPPAAPGTQFYTIAGAHNWTVPSDVTAVRVTLVGAGGSGGQNGTWFGSGSFIPGGGGGGGGAGAVVQKILAVAPGDVIPVTIGAGAEASIYVHPVVGKNTDGTSGQQSTFGSLLTAAPGMGGGGGYSQHQSSGAGGAAGAGAVASGGELININGQDGTVGDPSSTAGGTYLYGNGGNGGEGYLLEGTSCGAGGAGPAKKAGHGQNPSMPGSDGCVLIEWGAEITASGSGGAS
ncbi:FG-GAP repeat domain-containing protein [Kiloniella sp.]|uniref:FG-GAP repeat domain-containing protein n=1 Tax=Kiloniella sp. TaxID=1938587 RepID=UPI003A8D23D2